MHVSRVIIFTRDVRRLSEFYRRNFALERVGGSDDGWTELASGTCSLAFHACAEDSPHRDGWVKIVFGARDVAAERERLLGLGVEMSGMVEFGYIQLCDGRDPDGNWFQISSRGVAS